MFEYWKDVYEKDLKVLYQMYLQEHEKNKRLFQRVIPFSFFCKVVYDQSSRKINKYDVLDIEENDV